MRWKIVTLTIEARGLTKRFGKKTALDGLTLEVESGQVVAVLGPNGAGKTTFVRSVSTLIRPESGELKVCGYDVRREAESVRRVIGLAGQYAAVDQALSGRENLVLVARLFGQSAKQAKANAEAVIELFGLVEAADRLVRTYSGGMRRKLDLGASLVSQPRLLILDEPTTGLDPRSRLDLWDAIEGLVERGTDVLLTTQYLDEADRLAKHIVIIDQGRTVASGTPAELKRRIGGKVLEVHVRDRAHIPLVAQALSREGVAAPQIDESTRRISVGADDGAAQWLIDGLSAVRDSGAVLADIAVREPSLDEVFLALTGQKTSSAETVGAATLETA
jgi:ABC-2 type transport system ATP-binding protein